MNIYLNREPKSGPWGGGNRVVVELSKEIVKNNWDLTFELTPDVDVIFCFDPRPNNLGIWYQDFLNHKNLYNSRIIQRIGDLGTHGKPELTNLVRQTMSLSDYLIFPSQWAKQHIGFEGQNCKVVNNRPAPIFHENKRNNTVLDKKIQLVTHHWSTNPKKGFSIYKKIDDFLDQQQGYEFTYIGRLPQDLKFRNIKHVPPIDAAELAKKLPEYDIYVTASIEEAGANHVLEAMACGLPVVYHDDGGSIVNYCEKYGEGFSSFSQLMAKIKKVIENYDLYKRGVLAYNEEIAVVIQEYIDVIYNKRVGTNGQIG